MHLLYRCPIHQHNGKKECIRWWFSRTAKKAPTCTRMCRCLKSMYPCLVVFIPLGVSHVCWLATSFAISDIALFFRLVTKNNVDYTWDSSTTSNLSILITLRATWSVVFILRFSLSNFGLNLRICGWRCLIYIPKRSYITKLSVNM